jgi:hypothetical protein
VAETHGDGGRVVERGSGGRGRTTVATRAGEWGRDSTPSIGVGGRWARRESRGGYDLGRHWLRARITAWEAGVLGAGITVGVGGRRARPESRGGYDRGRHWLRARITTWEQGRWGDHGGGIGAGGIEGEGRTRIHALWARRGRDPR